MEPAPNSNAQPEQYNIAAIRNLIRDAFTAEDLRRFCQDRPTFKPILSAFGPKFSFEDMIDAVVVRCEKQDLFSELLNEIREYNPSGYERYWESLHRRGARRRVVNLRPWYRPHTFHGRQSELQTLRKYLADDQVRLIEVLGQGGMGKTALASTALADFELGIEAASSGQMNRQFDGILYLSAANGLDLERVYFDAARMLDEPAARRLADRWTYGNPSATARTESLLEALQAGCYFILIDNMESALSSDGEIAEEGLRLFFEGCLTRSNWLRIIITSRHQLRLPPFALASVRTINLVDGLSEEDAMSMLRDLDPQAHLGLQQAPIESLLQGTRRVRGVPLALELLAGLLAEYPDLQVEELLADEELVGEKVIDRLLVESYRRLGENERRTLQALAVFDRPVGAAAVSFLLLPWCPDLDVGTALRRLVARFMAAVSRSSHKYSLHPLNREYAYAQVPSDGEGVAYSQSELELRAAEFYASIRKPESEWKTIDDLAPQLGEFEHRVRAGDYEAACQLVGLIDTDYLYLWGYCAHLIELREKVRVYVKNPHLQMVNLSSLGYCYHNVGQLETAIKCSEQALAIAYEVGDRTGMRSNLGNLANCHYSLRQLNESMRFYREALAVARDIGDRAMESRHLGDLGSVCRDLGQIEQAVDLYTESLSIARSIGTRWMEEASLGRLGHAYCLQGKVGKSVELLQQALLITREIGGRWDGCNWLGYLGHAYGVSGQSEKAVKCYQEGLALARELGYRWMESYALIQLSQTLLVAGNIIEARKHCEQALALNMVETSCKGAAVLGIILLHQRAPSVEGFFADAAARCHALLARTPNLYETRYALAALLVGTACCDSNWLHDQKRAELLIPAIAAYHQALENCFAPGIVQDAIRDIELIQAAGIEGLEPVLKLLRRASGKLI